MQRWFDRMRFLWEEQIAPPEEVPRGDRAGPAGVPRSLRRATRSALIGFAATSLLCQIVQVRMVAPVDAATNYVQQCDTGCTNRYNTCTATAQANYQTCQKTVQARIAACVKACGDPNHVPGAKKCILFCQASRPNLSDCQNTQHSDLANCVGTRDLCTAGCDP